MYLKRCSLKILSILVIWFGSNDVATKTIVNYQLCDSNTRITTLYESRDSLYKSESCMKVKLECSDRPYHM